MNWNRVPRVALLLMAALVAGCAGTPESRREQPQTETAITPELRSEYQQVVALVAQDPARARQELQRLHQAYPDLNGPLLNLCILDFNDERYEAAQACFERVLARDPEQPDALNHLGVIARRNGAFGEAEDYYRRALTANPEHRPSLRNLGILLDLYRGEHREALRLYEQYQALLPEPDPMVAQWVADLKNRL